MSATTIIFVTELVNSFPGLNSLFKEHAQDNFGETLPNVFFGDVTQYAVCLSVDIGRNDLKIEILQLLGFLENSSGRRRNSGVNLLFRS